MKTMFKSVVLLAILSLSFVSCRNEEKHDEDDVTEMINDGADVDVSENGNKVKVSTDDKTIKIKTDDNGNVVKKKVKIDN